jgi:VWFA-related protein
VEGVLVELDGEEGVKLWVGGLLAAALTAQETPVFRAGTSLALVRFHAAKSNRYVEDLTRDDVILLEDGKPRPFTVFEAGTRRRTVPLDVALVFDTSGSVTDNGLLDASAFKTGLLDAVPSARLAVYGFARRMRRFCPPTREYEKYRAALNAVEERKPSMGVDVPLALPPKRRSNENGASWIYEAAIGAARDLAAQGGSATRTMVIFSDGQPTTTTTPEDAARVCEELGVAVYPVLLGHWQLGERMRVQQQREASRGPNAPPSAASDRLNAQEDDIQEFASLGRLTGGGAFDPPAVGPNLLRRILEGLAARAQFEYVLGFSPESGGEPRRRKLEVRLRDKSLGRVIGGKRAVIH